MEKTATTSPLDPEIFLPLAPSTPPHALSLLTTPSEAKRIDGLSLLPSPMITDTQSFIPYSTDIMHNLPTMPLRKTYLFAIHLSIMLTSSLMDSQEPSMFAPFSSPNISKENSITVSGKLPHQIFSLILSARTPTTPAGSLLTDFFLKVGRMTVETLHMFPMKQPIQETISGAKLSEVPMSKWHTCEHKNASNTPPSTPTR